MSQFLDLFIYEKSVHSEGNNTIYYNCTLLKKIGDQNIGTKIECICMAVKVMMWQGDDLIEDECFNL